MFELVETELVIKVVDGYQNEKMTMVRVKVTLYSIDDKQNSGPSKSNNYLLLVYSSEFPLFHYQLAMIDNEPVTIGHRTVDKQSFPAAWKELMSDITNQCSQTFDAALIQKTDNTGEFILKHKRSFSVDTLLNLQLTATTTLIIQKHLQRLWENARKERDRLEVCKAQINHVISQRISHTILLDLEPRNDKLGTVFNWKRMYEKLDESLPSAQTHKRLSPSHKETWAWQTWHRLYHTSLKVIKQDDGEEDTKDQTVYLEIVSCENAQMEPNIHQTYWIHLIYKDQLYRKLLQHEKQSPLNVIAKFKMLTRLSNDAEQRYESIRRGSKLDGDWVQCQMRNDNSSKLQLQFKECGKWTDTLVESIDLELAPKEDQIHLVKNRYCEIELSIKQLKEYIDNVMAVVRRKHPAMLVWIKPLLDTHDRISYWDPGRILLDYSPSSAITSQRQSYHR